MSGEPPPRIHVGTGGLAEFQLVKKQLTLMGGAPGAGKTAFTSQLTIDALRMMPELRAVVCNVEMSPEVLMERQLARLSGVSLTTIRDRKLQDEHAEPIGKAFATLESVTDRLCFVEPPFALANVAATAEDFDAELLILDYIQRIQPEGNHDQDRGRVNACMDTLRLFAAAGCAVLVISAVGRTKDSSGRSSYAGNGMNLASFRESSELEFGADDAYILHPDGDDAEGDEMKLKHLKSRHGECRDMLLDFDRPRQRFTATDRPQQSPEERAGVRSKLADLWDKAKPAGDDDE